MQLSPAEQVPFLKNRQGGECQLAQLSPRLHLPFRWNRQGAFLSVDAPLVVRAEGDLERFLPRPLFLPLPPWRRVDSLRAEAFFALPFMVSSWKYGRESPFGQFPVLTHARQWPGGTLSFVPLLFPRPFLPPLAGAALPWEPPVRLCCSSFRV